jgi:predicted nucleic-acid-binding protein
MIALDTNVLLRVLIDDDPAQTVRARGLIEKFSPEEPGFVSQTVLIETVWVLHSRYRFTRAALVDAMDSLFTIRQLEIDNATAAHEALALFRSSNAEFADCMVARSGIARGCEYTVTFDKAASKLPGMRLLG